MHFRWQRRSGCSDFSTGFHLTHHITIWPAESRKVRPSKKPHVPVEETRQVSSGEETIDPKSDKRWNPGRGFGQFGQHCSPTDLSMCINHSVEVDGQIVLRRIRYCPDGHRRNSRAMRFTHDVKAFHVDGICGFGETLFF